MLVGLLTVGGTAQAANFRVADPTSAPGNDATCAPCLTIAGALRKAAATPGKDRILLGPARYPGNVVIRDNDAVWIEGVGARTLIEGTIDVATPRRGDRYVQGSIGRHVSLSSLVISSPARAVSSDRVDIWIADASIYGAVWVANAGASVARSTIAGRGCAPALVIDAGNVGRVDPLEIGMSVSSVVGRSTILGQPAIAYRGATDVFDSLFVQRSLVGAGSVGCAPQTGQAITVGGDGFAQVANSLLWANSPAAAGTAIAVTDSLVYATLSTITPGFATGISSVRSRVISQGMAIDGPAVAIDGTGGGAQALGAFELSYTFASGLARLGGGAVAGATNRFSTPLLLQDGSPTVGSPLIGAIPFGFSFNAIALEAYLDSYNGVERPAAAIVGGPRAYEAGAIELPAAWPGVVVPPDFQGPAWLPGRVGLGGVEVDLGGIGFPAPPGAPLAGAANAQTADGAAAGGQVATGPTLIIQPPKRVVRGTTVTVRVKVPYRGRLTLRTYGERGGLVAVGKGRPVVKGWRNVKLTIGPNTRLGTLRIVATHVRPQTRAILTAANVTRVVKG
jgi:hypothetical protein